MTEKASTVYSEFTCCGHTFTTAQSLKRHKESPSHKRLADPEFAKTEAAEKAAKDAEKAGRQGNAAAAVEPFYCNVCDTGHDFT